MISNRDIIITGLQAWDIKIGSNCKNIAHEFSKQNRVLYINPPLDRMTKIRNLTKNQKTSSQVKKQNTAKSLLKIKDNLWVFTPDIMIESISQLPVNWLFDIINKKNNKLFAQEISGAIKDLNFNNYIHFCDSDMFRSYYLKDLLNPSVSVYYSRDNLLAVKYWQQQGVRLEQKYMAKADLVLANSNYLASLALQYNNKSYSIGQGCDTSAFNPDIVKNTPIEFQNIPQPIIGYIGSLNSLRLDISTIEHIALTRSDWSIVLVGPQDNQFKESSLHQLSNVHFFGSKPEIELPEYLNAFDVAINPQALNEVTMGNYPRKIDEYLAMGKPTVATNTMAMKFFSDYVSLANSKNDWIKCIEFELGNTGSDVKNKRILFANEHTWENNVNKIYTQIKKVENEKQIQTISA